MTVTDDQLRDALAPLRAAEPTEIDVAAVLAAASAAPRPRWRLVAAAATVTAVAGMALAALPGGGRHGLQQPLTATGLLRAAAAVAADQPEPPAWAGYRYVKARNLWASRPFRVRSGKLSSGDPYTVEQTEETWVDRHWNGRRLASAGRLVSGRAPASDVFLRPHDISAPGDMPNLYGDGPLAEVPLDTLPTEPRSLYDLLVAAYKDLRWARGGGTWAPGHPSEPQAHYDVLRSLLVLLTEANATPAQRAALIGVLGEYDGVRPLPAVRDHENREGRGVEIPVENIDGHPAAPVRVIFAPGTSELLEWSQGGEVHTFERFGHVDAIGDRP
jgi:hypothetical protein